MESKKFFAIDGPRFDYKRWWWLNRVGEGSGDTRQAPSTAQTLNMYKSSGRERPNVIVNDQSVLMIDRYMRDVLVSVMGANNVGRVVVFDKTKQRIIDNECAFVEVPEGAGPRSEDVGAHLLLTDHWKRDPELTNAVGVFFDHSTWTGAHVFGLPNDGVIIVSSEVQQAIVRAGLTNLYLVPIEEYGRDVRDSNVQMLKDRAEKRRRGENDTIGFFFRPGQGPK